MKQKPTKVTIDDIELAEELSRITTIKGLLEGFSSVLTEHFAELSDVSFRGNPVATHFSIQDKWDVLETSLQFLQADLLKELGQVEEEDAHTLADPLIDVEESIPTDVPEMDTVLGKPDDDDEGTIEVGEPV
jgi:hypothetical protein